jgi:hypothetical protein
VEGRIRMSRKELFVLHEVRLCVDGSQRQMDGSFHDWLGTGDLSCLMVMVDDATGRTLARLNAQGTTEVALEMLGLWARGGPPLGWLWGRMEPTTFVTVPLPG